MVKNTLLRLQGITKIFDGFKALDNVDLTIDYGEVVGLVGDNGAGKSTLVKIIMGVYKPDGGKMFFEGKEVDFKQYGPSVAFSMGIVPVYQERALAPNHSIRENIFMGRELVRYGFLRINEMKLSLIHI